MLPLVAKIREQCGHFAIEIFVIYIVIKNERAPDPPREPAESVVRGAYLFNNVVVLL